MAFSWWKWRSSQPLKEDEYAKQIENLRKHIPIPAIWLLGKTGSGKSSVVRQLTGSDSVVIGESYRPETRASTRYDFPNPTEPLLTFWDTRGLAEAGYDPTGDIDGFSAETQLIIVTVRVRDHALESLLAPLRQIRKAVPTRPVLLVITCLHEASIGFDITEGIDPFSAGEDSASGGEAADRPSPVPQSLQTLIDEKKRQFDGLFDEIVPVDLTRVEDGFADPDFGSSRLKQAILDRLPHAYRQALLALYESHGDEGSSRKQRARWQVLGSSALAGTAGAVPIPWVDIPVVLAIQAHLAVRLAQIYEQELTAARWASISGAAGGRIAIQLAIRETLKFIPLVGIAAGAAGSFAFTYALGMSWDWYFSDLRKGNAPSPEVLKQVFAAELKRGHELWGAR